MSMLFRDFSPYMRRTRDAFIALEANGVCQSTRHPPLDDRDFLAAGVFSVQGICVSLR